MVASEVNRKVPHQNETLNYNEIKFPYFKNIKKNKVKESDGANWVSRKKSLKNGAKLPRRLQSQLQPSVINQHRESRKV